MPPTLETLDGSPVGVPPLDADAVNATFSAAMNDDGPDEQAPPKRQPRAAEPDAPKRKPARAPRAEQARTTSKPGTVLDNGQRANAVKGLVQVAAGGALMAGKMSGKDKAKADAFRADAVTLASSAEQIADAMVQTASADPKFAQALDKVLAAGPYAALISVMVGVGTQIARNHKPSLKIPGTVDPAELVAAQDETESVNA
jgi:hypothetical protein